ncbi:DNA (cytosine-5-)-methyltransferase [Pasteurella multocida]|uniref:DNA (cytosine-5-)-methyltransferase n=1 Tax=Pasteurella multocida TaxID=747 RepID=UPI00094B330A|nr:DNA (cytosine-5-)-methyltransferase [Pasteurella multocida]HEH9626270.1 DNA (cytosine-5-)-methyltransferase [Pasteurella multocida]HEH9666934.1 DNA (cytosine-5-)-methyltransferase [Pasteurella multocida]HEH9728728.1 DNA (cytosine-5-)-methyltransferase [Pasteurella multocida]HEH9821254.1 DNA (cytosine-5-)-methyltransferase [Pasteurella multocida]HEH9823623.1 DNA (cytosine-5-)-methyltransferase [Pasteurella multocida]
MSFRVAELFAGIGGIGLGFINAGFEVVWANELDKNACETYRANFKHTIINADMKELSTDIIPDIDILTGGFPCQAFSIAGYQKGFDDDRGNIFFDIMRYIRSKRPAVVFLENVKNLSSHDKGKTFRIIQEALQSEGYFIKSSVLNTSKVSKIPQNRERIYIVGFRNTEHCENFKFPEELEESAIYNIRQMLEEKVDDYYYYDNSKYIDELKKEITDPDAIYQWRRIYVRKNKSGLCPTLTANMGTGGHNVPLIYDHGRIRKLTPRECIRFQGFPDDFILPDNLPKSALYKQIGNSVSVPVIELIAKNIKQALEK